MKAEREAKRTRLRNEKDIIDAMMALSIDDGVAIIAHMMALNVNDNFDDIE